MKRTQRCATQPRGQRVRDSRNGKRDARELKRLANPGPPAPLHACATAPGSAAALPLLQMPAPSLRPWTPGIAGGDRRLHEKGVESRYRQTPKSGDVSDPGILSVRALLCKLPATNWHGKCIAQSVNGCAEGPRRRRAWPASDTACCQAAGGAGGTLRASAPATSGSAHAAHCASRGLFACTVGTSSRRT